MLKLGLKLWSNNTDFYLKEAQKLYSEGVFDFIELYIAPNADEFLESWKKLKIPFSIHATHFNHGINLADKEKFDLNKKSFEKAFYWADVLKSEYIIFHPGVLGDIKETVRQINLIKDDRMAVENKPPYQIPSMRECRGAKFEEIEFVVKETGVKFCLDIGHCISSANYFKENIFEYLEKFQSLSPVYYHLMDNFSNSTEDRHLNLGQGDYDFNKILKIINLKNPILLETNKKSRENLEDFVQDVQKIKVLGG